MTCNDTIYQHLLCIMHILALLVNWYLEIILQAAVQKIGLFMMFVYYKSHVQVTSIILVHEICIRVLELHLVISLQVIG